MGILSGENWGMGPITQVCPAVARPKAEAGAP